MKKKKKFSTNDLKREVKNIGIFLSMLSQRLLNLEKLFQLYVEMNKHEKKFEKFLDAKKEKSVENK
jgi:hypothetical protein